MNNQLVRIGVFYDGNYFFRASSYYAYGHSRKTRLSISGLHDFIRHSIAAETKSDVRLCHIVDAHYFRGRLSAYEASQRGDTLYWDRVFDDILMSEGVTTHYLPVKTVDGLKQEKGIDVLLALEAFEMALYKKFDVLVLIASDGDYVPLIRKLNTLNTRVMVLSWDFEYTDDSGRKYTTRTSQELLEEVTYPIAMHEVIDNRIRRNEPLVNNLFVQSDYRRPNTNSNGSYHRSTAPAFQTQPSSNGGSYFDPIDEGSEQFEQPKEEPKTIVEPPQTEPIKVAEVAKVEVPKVETPKVEVPKVEPIKTEPLPHIANLYAKPEGSSKIEAAAKIETQAEIQAEVKAEIQAEVALNNSESSKTEPVQQAAPEVQPYEYTPPQQDPNLIFDDHPLEGEVQRSEILSLKDGYGFIKYKPNNLFFHYTDMLGVDFNELNIGDFVEFIVGYKEDGRGFATNVRLFE